MSVEWFFKFIFCTQHHNSSLDMSRKKSVERVPSLPLLTFQAMCNWQRSSLLSILSIHQCLGVVGGVVLVDMLLLSAAPTPPLFKAFSAATAPGRFTFLFLSSSFLHVIIFLSIFRNIFLVTWNCLIPWYLIFIAIGCRSVIQISLNDCSRSISSSDANTDNAVRCTDFQPSNKNNYFNGYI